MRDPDTDESKIGSQESHISVFTKFDRFMIFTMYIYIQFIFITNEITIRHARGTEGGGGREGMREREKKEEVGKE